MTLTAFYDYRLVTLSCCIAVLTAYSALEIAGKVGSASGRIRYGWLFCGAVAVGFGIWGMQCLGMGAFQLPIPVLYDWPTLLMSLASTILGSVVALYVARRKSRPMWQIIFASICMGGGVAEIHYFSMQAMRSRAQSVQTPWVAALSVSIAVASSFLFIRSSSYFNAQFGVASWSKLRRALVIGLAIAATHYTGVAAATFYPRVEFNGDVRNTVVLSALALSIITVATIVILAFVLLSLMVDRRFSEQAQHISQGLIQSRLIFDNLKECIVLYDLDRNLIKCNRATHVLLGSHELVRSEADQAKAFEVFLPTGESVPPDNWPGAMACRGEYLESCEMQIRRRDTGKTLIFDVSTAPIVNDAGETIQIIVFFRDVTQPRLADEVRMRLAAIVECSEDAIIGKDGKGIVTSWNLGAEKMFGYASTEMIGQSIRRLLPEDRLYEEDEILAHIGRGEAVDHIETIRKKKNGQSIHVSLSISPIRDAMGTVIGASKIARNITERRQLEAQLHQSQKMDAIGQLTGGVAHDFNNLLGVVVGNLDLLERQLQGNEPALKKVHAAQRASMRGAELTRRLLAFSSQVELSPSAVDLNASIQNTVELAGRVLGPEIRIVLQLDKSVPIVFADLAGLESALLNLMLNARDAMPRGGAITIISAVSSQQEAFAREHKGDLKEGRYAYVSVSDTGSGMTREVMSRAFEPFFTTKPRDKGTGLGLAMVYGFFKQSGGTVRLYSELGYGTTVSFYLPLAADLPALSQAASQHTFAKEEGAVLVVDDETDLLEVAVSYLDEMGYTALQAKCGPEALELIRNSTWVGLLITDVIMPGGMNGAELAKAARLINPTLKVIYCSGFPADALAERNMQLVGGSVLRKPYQRVEFNALVHEVMHGDDPSIHQEQQ